MRISSMCFFMGVFFSALALYAVKYRVEEVKQEVNGAERQLVTLKDSIHMLHIEWAYLTHPERVKRLAQRHIDMIPLRGTHVIDMSLVPKTSLVGNSYQEGAE